MQKTVIVISLAYAILFGWLWYDVTNASNDAAGYGMAIGFLSIGMSITALFVVPALILALLGKLPRLALGLSLVPAVLIVVAAMADVI